MIDRSLAVREVADPARFLDVQYRDTVEDPLKQLRRICEWIGEPIDDEIARTMSGFLDENPQHKHGRHTYELSDFGLSAAQVRERFAGYRARFGFGD